MKKGKQSRNWILNILIVIAAAVMVFSGYQLYQTIQEYRQGEAEYEELASFAEELKEELLQQKPSVSVTIASTAEDETQEKVDVLEETEAAFDQEAYAQWFAKLREINPDIVGWIRIDGTVIDYPVMYSGDNDYYLYRTYQRTTNGAGSIFVEGSNTPDFSDYHTILYGHNMQNGSMFAGLHKYAKESYYQAHPVILLDTASGPRQYEIFSCHTANAYDKLYDISYVGGEKYGEFVSCLKNLSDYETGVDVSDEDFVLTLSTCKGNGDLRYVVHAKLVK